MRKSHDAKVKPEGLVEGFPGARLYVCPPDIQRILRTLPLTAGLHVTDAGYFPAAHHHYRERPDGCPEAIVIVCQRGHGWCRMGGQTMRLGPGRFIMIPPDMPHAYAAAEGDPWSIYWAHFRGAHTRAYLGHFAPGNYGAAIDGGLLGVLARDFEILLAGMQGGMTVRHLVHASAVLNQILASLFFANPAFVPGVEPEQYRVIERTIQRMQEQVGEGIDIAGLAKSAGFSVPHYYRLFKSKTGHAPLEFFNRLKVQQACQQLLTGSRSIKEIGDSLGYSSPYYFSRAFKKVMDICPSGYQRGHLR